MKYFMVLAVNVAFSSVALGGWLERQEQVIESAQFQMQFPLSRAGHLSIQNDYGPTDIEILDSAANAIYLTGTFGSIHPNSTTIQFIRRKEDKVDLFVDGPAGFKTHEHVKAYGKPLDRAFFEQNVGKISGIERGDEPGSFLVGGSFKIGQRGLSFSQDPGSFLWGTGHFSSTEIQMDEGHSIGRLFNGVFVNLRVAIPTHLVGQVTMDVKKAHAIGVMYPPNREIRERIVMEKTEERFALTDISMKCFKLLADKS